MHAGLDNRNNSSRRRGQGLIEMLMLRGGRNPQTTYWMAFVFELFFSHSGRVSFVTQNVVMVVPLVVDCIDDLVETLGPNRWAVLQRADGQSLSKQQFLVECCWRQSAVKKKKKERKE